MSDESVPPRCRPAPPEPAAPTVSSDGETPAVDDDTDGTDDDPILLCW